MQYQGSKSYQVQAMQTSDQVRAFAIKLSYDKPIAPHIGCVSLRSSPKMKDVSARVYI